MEIASETTLSKRPKAPITQAIDNEKCKRASTALSSLTSQPTFLVFIQVRAEHVPGEGAVPHLGMPNRPGHRRRIGQIDVLPVQLF